MNLFSDSHIPQAMPPCVATVGFFDGVHAGHRFLIDELKSIATQQQLHSVVFTFGEHPRKVLQPTFKPLLITTLHEKIEQLQRTGVDSCVLLHFDKEMAQLSASEFLDTLLLKRYNVKTLLVGHDHRFGHNRTDGFEQYKAYGQAIGMEVIQASQYATAQDTYISSSEVRNALLGGNVLKANRLLAYHYSLQGRVVRGFQVGRKIGFPTANISCINTDKLIPASGVYAVKVKRRNDSYSGMLNIGTRPTIDNGNELTIEVHIIDFDGDIYNEIVELVFVDKIRDEIKFENIEQLIAQLHADKLHVCKLLEINI